jgi:hypothetical protein
MLLAGEIRTLAIGLQAHSGPNTLVFVFSWPLAVAIHAIKPDITWAYLQGLNAASQVGSSARDKRGNHRGLNRGMATPGCWVAWRDRPEAPKPPAREARHLRADARPVYAR